LFTDIILIGFIIFLASFSQGLTGFGFAMTSLPLLSLIIGVKEAVPLSALCGFIVNIYLTYQLKAHIDFSEIKLLVIGSIFGIPLGVFFLSKADEHLVMKILAGIILVFVFLNSTQFIKPFNIKNKWGIVFGFISGILGSAFNTNGPPVLIYFYLKDWDKFKQKASITGYFIITSVLIVVSHAVSGITTMRVLSHAIYTIPFLFAGLLLGSSLFPKVSTKLYRKIILIFLTVIGFILIFG